MPHTHSTPEDARHRAEARFSRAQQITEAATAIIQSELSAARAKTARLREERLAKEAREGVSELDEKPKGRAAAAGASSRRVRKARSSA
jgi:hypothetical protein